MFDNIWTVVKWALLVAVVLLAVGIFRPTTDVPQVPSIPAVPTVPISLSRVRTLTTAAMIVDFCSRRSWQTAVDFPPPYCTVTVH